MAETVAEVRARIAEKRRELLRQKARELRQSGAADLPQLAADFSSGANRGLLSSVMALPDLAGAALNAVGLPGLAPQMLTSDNAIAAMNQLGLGQEAQTDMGRRVQRVGQSVGATLPMAAGIQATANMGRQGIGLLRPAVQAAKNAPLRSNLEELGAAVTGGIGGAIAQEVAPESRTAEMAGEMAGSLGPSMVSSGVRYLARGSDDVVPTMQGRIEDFRRAGSTPTVGQASGRQFPQRLEQTLGRMPGGSRLAVRAQDAAERIGRRVDDIATNVSAGEPTAIEAGRAVQRGVEDFAGRFKEVGKALYDQLDGFISPASRVSVENTDDAFRALTANIEGAENISGILKDPKLERLAKAFTEDASSGALPYRALKELRTAIGDRLGDASLVNDIPKSALSRIYKAITKDMQAAAESAGPEAVAALNRANRYWRAGRARIDDVLQPLANKVEPEAAFKHLVSSSREGATKLRAVMRSLTNDQAKVLTAAMVRRLGRATASQQDAEGAVFSMETFLTNWNKLSPAAKSVLFNSRTMPRMAGDLDAIARASASVREASQALPNPSGTAGGTANIAALSAAGGAAFAGDVTTPLVIGGLAVTTNGGARLMSNPKFVNWLAQTTRMPVARLPGQIARLATVAEDVPADVARDIQAYISAFSEQEAE